MNNSLKSLSNSTEAYNKAERIDLSNIFQELKMLIRSEVKETISTQFEKLYQMQPLQSKSVFGLEEACIFINLSKSTLYKLTSQNRIPHYHRGRKLVFLKSELEKWLLENPAKTISQLENEASNYINKPLKSGRLK